MKNTENKWPEELEDDFNSTSNYLFDGLCGEFESKVEFDKGYWWTVSRPQYKAQSLHNKRLD